MKDNNELSNQHLVRKLMWFLLLVYVAEGVGQVGGLVSQPLTYFLKTALGWNADRVTEYLAILTFPWVIKPIYGLISDNIPLFGYRHKTYLILANAMACVGYLWLVGISDPTQIILGLSLTAVGMAASSTISGAVMVKGGKTLGHTGKFVGQQWLWFSLAGIVTSLAGGWLCQYTSPASAFHTAALIAAFAPVGVLFGAWFLIHEERVQKSTDATAGGARTINKEKLVAAAKKHSVWLIVGVVSVTASALYARDLTVWVIATLLTLWSLAVLRSKTMWIVAGFIAFWNFSPGFGTPLYYYMTDTLHFNQMFIGTLGMWSNIGSAAGAAMFMFWLNGRVSLKALIYWSIAIGTAAQFCHVWISSPASAVILTLLSSVAAQVATLTTLTLAAHACPDDAEGFSYAALMSVFNLAAQGSAVLGSWMYVHTFSEHLIPLIWVSSAFTAACVVLVPLLPKSTLARPAQK